MAVTELIFPALKPSPEDREAFKKVWPTLSNTFESHPDVRNGFYGWVVEEDGKDVRGGASRFVLLLEWDTYSSFTTFLSSPELRSFAGNIKPLLTAPPKPEVYETDGGPAACASAPMTEIFQLQLPAAGAESGNGVQAAKKAWGELLGVMEREGKGAMRGAISGRSLNLEGEVWVGMVGWENFEARETIRRKPEVQRGLQALREGGEMSALVVELKALGTEMA